jgi:hypothetical protein
MTPELKEYIRILKKEGPLKAEVHGQAPEDDDVVDTSDPNIANSDMEIDNEAANDAAIAAAIAKDLIDADGLDDVEAYNNVNNDETIYINTSSSSSLSSVGDITPPH